jgi:hypothetical protein
MRGRIRKQTHVDGRISWGFEIPYRDAVTNARRTFTRRRFPPKRAAQEALAEAVVRYQQGDPIAIDRTVTVGRLLAE